MPSDAGGEQADLQHGPTGRGDGDQFTDDRAGKQERGPREQGKGRAAGHRPDVGLDRIRQHRQPSGFAHQRCRHRHQRGRAARRARCAIRVSATEAPHRAGGHHRQPHHVQDVHLQEVDQGAPAKELRLQAEQERQREHLPAAKARRCRRSRYTARWPSGSTPPSRARGRRETETAAPPARRETPRRCTACRDDRLHASTRRRRGPRP